MIRILLLLLVSGCGGLLPPSSASLDVPEAVEMDPRCATADREYRTWHAVGTIFTSLGVATTGGGVVSDFVTDEKWVGIGLDLFGIASGALGLAGNLLADDAAEDVVRYCEGGGE